MNTVLTAKNVAKGDRLIRVWYCETSEVSKEINLFRHHRDIKVKASATFECEHGSIVNKIRAWQKREKKAGQDYIILSYHCFKAVPSKYATSHPDALVVPGTRLVLVSRSKHVYVYQSTFDIPVVPRTEVVKQAKVKIQGLPPMWSNEYQTEVPDSQVLLLNPKTCVYFSEDIDYQPSPKLNED